MEAFPAHEALRGSNDRMPFNIGVFRVRHISFLLDMTDDTQESNAFVELCSASGHFW